MISPWPSKTTLVENIIENGHLWTLAALSVFHLQRTSEYSDLAPSSYRRFVKCILLIFLTLASVSSTLQPTKKCSEMLRASSVVVGGERWCSLVLVLIPASVLSTYWLFTNKNIHLMCHLFAKQLSAEETRRVVGVGCWQEVSHSTACRWWS
jgi:hypothetical protein